MEGEENKSPNSIKITVKFGGRSIPISISPDSTINHLKSLLQSHTNVLPRGQKLIFKGKMLTDAMTLAQSEVPNGAKIMLMASQGLHLGDGPILKDAKTRQISRFKVTRIEKTEVSVDDKSLEKWKKTGVIALAECNLKMIPAEVWSCGPSIRVLNVNENALEDLPTKIGCLSSLQKLHLDRNCLSNDSTSWEGIKALQFLTVLSLSHNNLTALPSEVGDLSSLRQLDISGNKLNGLPVEIGFLVQLEILKANNNKISTLPTSIGNCTSLIEVNLSANHLTELPESLDNLHKLKALHLRNNGLRSLPRTLFKKCGQLSTLDLHNTEIGIDFLRQMEGFASFFERYQTKQQRQLDFRVVGSGEFDEGVDKSW